MGFQLVCAYADIDPDTVRDYAEFSGARLIHEVSVFSNIDTGSRARGFECYPDSLT